MDTDFTKQGFTDAQADTFSEIVLEKKQWIWNDWLSGDDILFSGYFGDKFVSGMIDANGHISDVRVTSR